MTQFGVYIGTSPQSLALFEQWIGKKVDTVLSYTNGSSYEAADPAWAISTLGSVGRQINWSIPMTPSNGGVTSLREAAAGLHDVDYTTWAQKILASRSGDTNPIYVRTNWELGGEWFNWTIAAQQDPAAYKGAFQHFSQSFHAVSPRFKIVWDFSGDRGPIESFYPGDQAIDVISQDIYWNPQWHGTDPTTAFNYYQKGMSRGLDWMANFAAQHSKPMAISEWGVPGDNGNTFDGATFIRLMKKWIDANNVLYANYWDGELASGYDGKLSDQNPGAAGLALKEMFNSNVVPPPAFPDSSTDTVLGSGSDALVIKLSQDAYLGNAQFTVSVDGQQIGGILSAKALHSLGLSDTVTIKGDWASGQHQVAVRFLNDAWGGSSTKDRNLYVDEISINSTTVLDAARKFSTSSTVTFDFDKPAILIPADFANMDSLVWKGQAVYGSTSYQSFQSEPSWGSGPNAKIAPPSWDGRYPSKLALDNFVQTEIDLSKAGSLGTELLIVAGKRGAVTLGDGNDLFTWLSHSNGPSPDTTSNAITVATGAGNDVVKISAVGLSSLADHHKVGNGGLYTAGYDGRHSTADITLGMGKDTVNVEGKVNLVLHAGVGEAVVVSRAGNDVFHLGKGTADLTSGAGRDSFLIEPGDGHAVIRDFVSQADTLKFIGVDQSAIRTTSTIENGTPGILITYDAAGSSVFLANVKAIVAGDLLFA